MNRTRKTFLTIIGIALVSVAVMVILNDRKPPAGVEPEEIAVVAPPGSVLVTIASSSTKQNWMEAVVEKFHAEGKETSKGSSVHVQVTGVLSGGSMLKILGGNLKPVVWSPGAVSWVDQFRERWSQQGNRPSIKPACKPSVYTPIGLAMWRPMAEALGWPGKPIGWQTIVDLAADPQGWARYGHPEWGKLKLGHPHPKYSNAGMLFVSSFVYGVTGKTGGLSAEEVYDPKVEQAMRTLARNTSKYGMISTDLLRLMAQNGPQFLHAVSAFEEGTVNLNLKRGDELRWPLVFIFPSEGTFWSSHPYCILGGADWVNAEQAEAAQLFLDYLLAEDQQAMAVQHLLRPLDSSIPIEAPLSLENGADPRVRLETVPALELPDSNATAAIIDQFLITKRKGTVLLVLDVSGSMQGASIRAATEATAAFLKRLHPDDEAGLVIFNDDIVITSEVQPVSKVAEGLSETVLNLVAGGSTNLHEAVCEGMTMLRELRSEDLAAGENRLYGMVLLSDGADTVGSVSENRMFATCLPSGAEADGIKVFPIAFGAEANRNVLGRIGKVSGGRMYKADPASIEKTYLKISAEQ
jgi:Ca-activated chloride channel family protein